MGHSKRSLKKRCKNLKIIAHWKRRSPTIIPGFLLEIDGELKVKELQRGRGGSQGSVMTASC